MVFHNLLSTQCLADHLDDPNWVVVDCRFSLLDVDAGRNEYLAGHIPGAHYAHLNADLSSPVSERSGRHPLPNMTDFCAKLAAWGTGPDSQVVVYDDMAGAIAARLWWLLKSTGHRAVVLLDGGWSAWVAEQRPQQQSVPENHVGPYEQELDRSCWLSTEQVQAAISKDEIVLLDARAAARFRGEIEPIDPIAGHVPGAINRPFEENLQPNGLFKPPAQLRREFLALLAGRDAHTLVHMCGSGVTACHNLLAMEVAGLAGSRLYAGSWSEWIRDPARPLALGVIEQT